MNDTDMFSREIAAKVPIKKLKSLRVLVCGAGNTGSHLIERLIKNFVGYVLIIDFDRRGYEAHNFQHSSSLLKYPEDCGKFKADTLAARAREKVLTPDCRYLGKTMDVRDIGSEFIKSFDYVIACFDNVPAREYLYQISRDANVAFIESGIGESGCHIQAFNHEKGAPCYGCTSFVPGEKMKMSCEYAYDDDISKGFAPSTDLLGAVAADLTTQFIINDCKGLDVPWNRYIHYDSESMLTSVVSRVRNPACSICGYEVPAESAEIDGAVDTMSFKDLRLSLDSAGFEKYDIVLPDTFVLNDFCPVCGKKYVLNKAQRRINMSDVTCKECIGKPKSKIIEHLAADCRFSGTDSLPDDVANLSLYELGFPYGGHITVISNTGDLAYISLKNDVENFSNTIKEENHYDDTCSDSSQN